ncbi:MAG TPA: sugar phosphate isomerase/epimerase [Solirubrobacteraceae bacterium]
MREAGVKGRLPTARGGAARRGAGARPLSFHSSAAGRRSLAWPEAVRIASGAGFDAVDVVVEAVDESAEAARARLDEAGLVAGGVPLPVEFRRDEDTFRRDLDELPARAALAREVGARVMHRSIPASSDVPRRELEPVVRRRLTKCAAVLADHGLDLAVEVLSVERLRRAHPHEFVWRLRDGAELAAACGPNAGILLDAWHWHHEGGAIEDVRAVGELVRHVHVADAPPLPSHEVRDDDRLLPGAGIIDLGGFLSAVVATGYDGAVTPEVFGHRCDGEDPIACARAVQLGARAVFPTE